MRAVQRGPGPERHRPAARRQLREHRASRRRAGYFTGASPDGWDGRPADQTVDIGRPIGLQQRRASVRESRRPDVRCYRRSVQLTGTR